MRLVLAALVVVATLVFTGVAASAARYADARDDANTPADVVSVDLADPGSGTVVVTVEVANYLTLPTGGTVAVWFDVDGDAGTGNAEGREARVRYAATGAIDLELWSGTRLIPSVPTGIAGSFADRKLTLTVPRATLRMPGRFGVYVVSSRGQRAGTGEFLASDAAPNSGNYVFPAGAAGPLRYTDTENDHHSAPDLTSVQVSDDADGWVDFDITMANATELPRAPVVGISIDVDNDASTGDGGADLGITSRGTDIFADRWSERSRSWVPHLDDPRIRIAVAGDRVILGVHRSELGASTRLGFAVLAAGLTPADAFTGVDVTPDGERFFEYSLENAAIVRLVAGKPATRPTQPVRGARLTVRVPISRSDTGTAIGSATVSCRVTVDGKRVASTGRFAGGMASCEFVVPKKAKRISGSIAVRADGISTRVPFGYRLR